ncbi:VOC family protein [Camelliibacillus cellulosilyticus]|uniref:VOC family protein n=1 Tax=Camelliibacillus cellulosilyticus TaxID=2174486 RepID=A0ABV9GNR2_9BACL
MSFQLDHLVHVTKNPLNAVEAFRSLGLHAVPGGRHENWGTRNGLCHFGLPYIEFLGIENSAIAKAVKDNTLIEQLAQEQDKGEGFARIALRTSDIDEAAEIFRRNGIITIGPVKGRRKQPNGELLEWSMLFIEETGEDRFKLPFIIDWKQSDEERKDSLVKRGIILEDEKIKSTLAMVAIATNKPEKIADQWEHLFGAKRGKAHVNQTLNAHCVPVHLHGHTILFCAPIGEGLVRKSLEARGERPFLATIFGENRDGSAEICGGLYQFV